MAVLFLLILSCSLCPLLPFWGQCVPPHRQFLGTGTDPCLSVSCIWCHRLTGKCREACSWSTSWVPSKLFWSVWAATMINNANWVAYKQQTFIPSGSEGRSQRSGGQCARVLVRAPSGLQMVPPLPPHRAEGGRSSLGLLHQGTSPIPEGSRPDHLLTGPTC